MKTVGVTITQTRHPISVADRLTDGQTNGRTKGWTDGRTEWTNY